MRQGSVPVGTKGCVPRLPPLHVRRARLERRLADAERPPVTLLCAAPGSGKTTLLAGALGPAHERHPVAWLCLDERDNDPDRLAALLAAALLGLAGDSSARRTRVPPLDRLDAAFDRLTAAGDGARRRALVLDDVHALRAPEALALVAHLVRQAPAQLDVALATRAEPSIGLEDLRLDGRLGEIRNADLAFDEAETAELLALHEVVLDADDLGALWRRTEGWAAGLRLAACALQTNPDPGRFVRSATRTAAVVCDYLLRELLARDEAAQQFLLRTSVCDRLVPELAAVLADDPGAGDHLDDLARSGVVLVDEEDDRWYRYHRLFGELLRLRLQREDPELARNLHGRAAQWFLERDMPAEAQAHARSAADWDLLGQLLAWRWVDATLEDHQIDGDVLPHGLEAAAVAGAPGLALVAAADACRRLNRDEAELYRDALDDLVARPVHAPAHEPDPFPNERQVLDVVFGRAFGCDERARDAAACLRSTAVADPAAVDLRRFGAMRAAELAFDADELGEARDLLADLADRGDRCWVTAEASALLALLHAVVGRPSLVGDPVDSVLDGGRGCASPEAVYAARLASVLALAQRGEQRSASDALAAAVPAGGRPIASRALRLVGRVAGIGVGAVPGRPVALDTAAVGSGVAERALLAFGVVEVVTPDGRPVPLGGQGERAVCDGRARLAAGGAGQADKLVAPWLADRGRAAHPRTVVEATTIAAIAAGARDEHAVALRHLGEALDLADATGVVAPMLSHGGSLAPLLQRNLSELGDRMSAAVALLDRMRPSGARDLIEPLTDREMEVLVHLPTLMSNAEIASGLYLSVNTVKTHLKALYRKLGVECRRAAVVRGRELELI